MENFSSSRNSLISDCYMATHNKIERFIGQPVNDACDAENLTQDVYLKLLEYDKELTADTITSLVYTIARNIVNDYLRHAYRTGAVKEYLRENSLLYSTDIEAEVSARDIAVMERSCVERLPRQRRIIYVMSRYFEKSIADISTRLSLSTRTVENPLRMGRRDVREYLAMVI